MNFLAHCGLAHDAARVWSSSDAERRGLLAGAVIGDFIKGPIPADWPTPLRAGARLHRKVDALSNVNPGIRDNCNRFPSTLRRFAPIFVDMLADHCLTLNWQTYYDMSITDFSRECYAAIDEYSVYLSPQAEQFCAYMTDVDLLANYDEWHHVARGLKSVLRRLNREQLFAEVEAASVSAMPGSHLDFRNYYPQLRDAWQNWDAFVVIAAPQNS